MKKIYLGLFCCCVFISTQSISQTWNGSSSTDWNDAANWTPNNVPSSTGNVIIDKASLSHYPLLPAHVSIRTLTMSAGTLNLNGFTLTCSVFATCTGDSLYNGKIVSATFNDFSNMHMGGKIVLEKTGPSNEFWKGNNKFHGDSLIIIWRSGSLNMQNAALSADSIFGNLKLVYADNNSAVYPINLAMNSPIFIQNDLILDNPDKGTFGLNSSQEKVIGGSIKALDFSNDVPNLPLVNVTVLGTNDNGPFYSRNGSFDNCRFNGGFSFIADSNATVNITNSSFLGSNNLLQAGSIWAHDNKFGQAGPGISIIRAAYNGADGNVRLRGGNNKFFGNAQWETYAAYPGGVTVEHTYYGADTTLGNLSFVLKGNASLLTNTKGPSYVQGNVLIDGQGARKWIQFTGGQGNTFTIAGSFTVKNFTPLCDPGWPTSTATNVHLRNITASGTDTCGTFYCTTGDINGCSFNGDFKLVSDSAQTYGIYSSSFLGANNLFQSGTFDFHDNRFGKLSAGITILRAAANPAGPVYMRGGNNKFFGDVSFETFETYPGGVTFQQNYYGKDTCLGNMTYILKGNASLITNEYGANYIAGNVVIDGQGAKKWIQFTGGAGNTLTVGGSFSAKNFTSSLEPGIPAGTSLSVLLRNITALGSDTCGTFYSNTGDIKNCNFNGDIKLIGDSAQAYGIYSSSLLGANNLFQSGALDFHDNRFGTISGGTTVFRAAATPPGPVFMRGGNNKFFGDVTFETFETYPGGVTIQQNYYGKDTCLGNMTYILKGNAALLTNEYGANYVAGNVVIDGQGAKKWIQFTGGSGNSFTVGGSFTAKNFTSNLEAGVPAGTSLSVLLRNITALGSDTCGTFYSNAGEIKDCNFNGDFKLIGDSAQTYGIYSSSLLGANNHLQSGTLDFHDNRFGKTSSGITILRAAHNQPVDVVMRDGNNKFLGDVQYETFALYPGTISIQQTYFGIDSCWGNMNFILKGNSYLTTNSYGNNYVKGNVNIDGQGARKWVQFSGGAGNNFYVDGNFTVKNFTPFAEPGVAHTHVVLRNLFVKGVDSVGTFYCISGDINNATFNGNFRLIADSTFSYALLNSSFLGADNLFQSGNLDVRNNRFGKENSGTTVLKVAHSTAGTLYMQDGNNKFFGDAEWIASPSIGSAAVQQAYHGVDTCLGNIRMNLLGNSSVDLAINGLYIGKGLSIQNNGTGSVTQNNSTPGIHFIGADTSSYVYSGTGTSPSLVFIEMNRRGGLRLLSPLTYRDYLVFTRGVILSSAANPVIVPSSAVVNGAWDSSYVDGPVKKVGNTAFTFPIGGNNVYAPLSISAPSSVTDAFTAQYFRHMPHIDGYDTTQHDVSLNHLSRKEYWTLNRTAGSSNVNVTLSWKTSRSGSVTNLSELRVARWNGSTWKDEGNGGTTGNTGEGTIQSLNTISSFSPFTLASTGPSNPLPVRFVSFDARLNINRTVLIQWVTNSEINNDHFEIERTTNLVNWTTIQKVASSYSHKYTCIDVNPAEGYNYYRIKQVDVNGSYLYTEIKPVLVETVTEILLRPNPVVNDLNLVLPFSKGVIEIATESGAVIMTKTINATHLVIPVVQLKAGTYFARITSGDKVYVKKFVKI